MQQQGLNVGYIAFNVEKKPFDSKLVRQALNMAVNKKAILDNGVPGRRRRWRRTRSRRRSGATTTRCQDYPYDPAKAKALLAQAGYPNGVEVELWYLPVTRPYNPDGKRMAELIQADWEKVGVKTKLITYEWGEYRKRSKTGEQHAMMFGWSGDNGDPDNFFVPLLGCAAVKGGGNVARWCNKDFENLIQKAKLATRQTDRAGFYAKAQVIAQRGGAVDHDRPLGALRPGAQGSDRLQDGRDRAPLLPQGGHRRTSEGALRVRGMLAFVLKRLALVVPTFLGITLLVFSLIRLIPGDPVEALSGERGMTDGALPAADPRVRPRPAAAGAVRRLRLAARCTATSASRSITHEPVFSRVRGALPGDGRAVAGGDAVRAACSAARRHPRRGQAQHRLGLLGDGRVAHRLLDADLLVGAAADPHLLGRPRLDAGLGTARDPATTSRRSPASC